MKYEMNDEFKRSIILSDLDLSDNVFSDDWFRGFFTNPILKNLNLIDNEKKNIKTDIYINFFTIKKLKSEKENTDKDKDFYVSLNKEIKSQIIDCWKDLGRIKPIYSYIELNKVENSEKDYKEFLVLFLSNKKSNNIFDFNLIYNREALISYILDLLLKSHLLEKANTVTPVSFDIVSGKIFLNPEIKSRSDTGDDEDGEDLDDENKKSNLKNVSVFNYFLRYSNFKLNFKIEHKVFVLEDTKGSIDIYEDFCYLNNYKYGKKEDAREHSRPFFNFKSYERLSYSRFATQLRLYKDILEMCDKYGIIYRKTNFTPQYIYADFPEVKIDIKELNLYMSSQELLEYSNYLKQVEINYASKGKDVKQDFNTFKEFFEMSFGLKINLILDANFEDIYNKKDQANLVLMYGNKYENEFVSFLKDDGKFETWNDPLIPFMKYKIYELDEENLFKFLDRFDFYSKVKIYNLYANKNNLTPIVSQGLIINGLILKKQVVRQVSPENIDENGFIVDDATRLKNNRIKKKELKNQKEESISLKAKKIKVPGKKIIFNPEFENLAKKVINELDIKYKLFVNQRFNFKTVFSEFNKLDIRNIKVINMYPKKEFKVYSYLELENSSNLDGFYDSFNVITKKILLEENINELNFDFNLNEELKISDSLIIINEEYLIKLKDNNLMPILILEENNFNVMGKDPLLIINEKKINDSSKAAIKKTAKPDSNICYPFNILTTSAMIKEKSKNIKGNHNAMLDFNNNMLRVFMNLKTNGVKETIAKNNRLECLEIFKMKDFCFEKSDWENNENLLNFYLSSIPFNYITNEGITKKSLLAKINDIILLN